MQRPPLCVDCDGTLIRSDLLFEAMLQVIKKNPLCIFLLPYVLIRHGKARLKMEVARRTAITPECLPYTLDFLDYLRAEHATGRRLVLVTGAPLPFALEVARHVGLFSEVYGTTELCNLTGSRKRDFLCSHFGKGNYEYAGNEAADMPIWESSGGVILVNAPSGIGRSIPASVPVAKIFPAARAGIRTYVRALRVHQWLKNLLIFVPLAVSHRVNEPSLVLAAITAFGCFSLTASAVYVLNDLLDLGSDRLHPRKRFRPFAAGQLSVIQGIIMAAACLLVAIGLSSLLPPLFWITLGGYFIATTAYSFALKNRAMVDMLLLAALYTVRIIGGSTATMILPSFWLLAFSMFLFLSLAVVKRYAELILMTGDGKKSLHGRGYVASDIPLLVALGVANGVIAVLVLALYINSPDVGRLYRSPELLWLMPPLMLYWICRVWLKTHRGKMHDDPIVFAASDRPSLITGAIFAALLLVAAMHNG